MKNDSRHSTEVAVPLTSRRNFIRAAVATGGAGILSAELAVLTAPTIFRRHRLRRPHG